MQSVDLGSVQVIESWAFAMCDSLKDVTIPDTVTSIGEYAFWSCKALKQISIGNGVTEIGRFAFGGCLSVTDLVLSSSLKNISRGVTNAAFYFKSNARINLYFYGTQEDWNAIRFQSRNDEVIEATRYYYSETQPTDTAGKYWHYVEGVPTAW